MRYIKDIRLVQDAFWLFRISSIGDFQWTPSWTAQGFTRPLRLPQGEKERTWDKAMELAFAHVE